MSNNQEHNQKNPKTNTKAGVNAKRSSRHFINLPERYIIIENSNPTASTSRHGSGSNSQATNLTRTPGFTNIRSGSESNSQHSNNFTMKPGFSGNKPRPSVNKSEPNVNEPGPSVSKNSINNNGTSSVKDPTGTVRKDSKFGATDKKLTYNPNVIFNCNVDDFGDLVFKILEETEHLIKILSPLMISVRHPNISIAVGVLLVNRDLLKKLIGTPSYGIDLDELIQLAHVLLLNWFKFLDIETSIELILIESSYALISVYIMHSQFNHVAVLITLLTMAEEEKPSEETIPFFPLKKSRHYRSRSSYYGINKNRKYSDMPSTSGYPMKKSKKLYPSQMPSKQSEDELPKYIRSHRPPSAEDSSSDDSLNHRYP